MADKKNFFFATKKVIKDVEISIPNLKLGGLNIIWTDTPGTNSAIRAHSLITLKMVAESDACLYVKRGSQPTETRETTQLTNQLHNKEKSVDKPVTNEPLMDLGPSSKSKTFVALTHLDLRTTALINKAIELNLNELSPKFDVQNVVPLDSRYGLLKKTKNLSPADLEELKAYESSEAFMKSELPNGLDKLSDKLTKFIQTDLPLSRVHDAQLLIKNTQLLFEQAKSSLQREASSVEEFQTKLDNQKEAAIKELWKSRLLASMNDTNSWVYYNFLNKIEELKQRWEKIFLDSFSAIFTHEEALPSDLQKNVPFSPTFLGKINLDPIEDQ